MGSLGIYAPIVIGHSFRVALGAVFLTHFFQAVPETWLEEKALKQNRLSCPSAHYKWKAVRMDRTIPQELHKNYRSAEVTVV